MSVQEKNILRFGSPNEIAKQIQSYAQARWVHCERRAEVVAGWLCDSFFSSHGIFGDWAYLAGTPLRRSIEANVEADVVIARSERGRARRQWARDVAVAYGTEAQAARAMTVPLPRGETEDLVFGFLGAGNMPVSPRHCKMCGAQYERQVEILMESRYDRAADRIVKTLQDGAVGFWISAETVMATYRCRNHGIVARYELVVHVEHAGNGWVGTRLFDLSGCAVLLSDLYASDLE